MASIGFFEEAYSSSVQSCVAGKEEAGIKNKKRSLRRAPYKVLQTSFRRSQTHHDSF